MVEEKCKQDTTEPSGTDAKDRGSDESTPLRSAEKSAKPSPDNSKAAGVGGGNFDTKDAIKDGGASGGAPTEDSTVVTTGAVVELAVGAFAIGNPLSNATSTSAIGNHTSQSAEVNGASTTQGSGSSSNEVSGLSSSSFHRTTITAESVPMAVATPIWDVTAADTSDEHNSNLDARKGEGDRKPQGLVAIVALILVALAVVIAVVLSRQSENPVIDEFEEAMSKRRSAMIEFLGELIDPDALEDPSQPTTTTTTYSDNRIAALRWIVEEDSMRLPIPTRKEIESGDLSVWKLRERYLMVLLYYSLNGDQWTDDYNFLSKYDVCRWTSVWSETQNWLFEAQEIRVKGALCGEEGKVTMLKMWWNNLSGTLPDEIGFFSETMKEINVVGGSISGTIPSSLTSFVKLDSLAVSDNCFTGTVPFVPSLSILTVNTNDQLEGNLEDYCDDGAYKDGVVAVAVDDSIDCSCCLRCFPERYECWTPPHFNLSYSLFNIHGPESFDSKNNTAQFMKQCISPEQREYIDEVCPCLVEHLPDDDESPFTSGKHDCDNCTHPDSRPSYT